MKHYFLILLACILLVGGGEPLMAAQQSSRASATMSAAAKKKAKAKAAQQKKKDRAKATQQKKKDRAKAAQQKKKDRAKAAQQKKKDNAIKKKEAKEANTTLHKVGFHAGAGYSGLVNKYEQNKFIGGGGGIIGIDYELQHKAFLFNVGPELRLFSSMDKLNLTEPYDVDFTYQDEVFTGPMIKHYQFDRLSENQIIGQLMLPVMLGAQFWQNRLYALAGVKVGYTLLKNYKQTGVVTSSITDPMVIDDWYNLTGHSASTYSYPEAGAAYGHGKNPFGLDITLSAEFGVNIGPLLGSDWETKNNDRVRPLHFRVAAFIDYGVMNMACASAGSIATPHYQYIETNSIHQSDLATSRLNSLLVGIKGTILLQMNKAKPAKKPKPRPSTETRRTETISEPEPEPEEPVVPIIKPRVWILNNLLFATAQATILPESDSALQELYDYLYTNPKARIRIVGHTDDIGTDRDNQILSENRAANVKAAMVERGIDAERIETEGRGESQPIDTNETEQGRARNRRVEIVRLD